MKLERNAFDKAFNERFPDGKMALFQVHNDYGYELGWHAQIEFIVPTKNKKEDWSLLGSETNCGLNFSDEGASLGVIDWEGGLFRLSNVKVFSDLDEFIEQCQKVGLDSVNKENISRLKKKITPNNKIVLKLEAYIQIDNDQAELDARCDIEHILYRIGNAIIEDEKDFPSIDVFTISGYTFDGDLITVQEYEDKPRYSVWKEEDNKLVKTKEVG